MDAEQSNVYWLEESMKEIFFIRHGRQSSRLCNVDVSLDDAGRRQAALAAASGRTTGEDRRGRGSSAGTEPFGGTI